MCEWVRQKFFGFVPANPSKSYGDAIKSTYERFGLHYDKVIRIWCTWSLAERDIPNVDAWKEQMAEEFHLQPRNFEILPFREVLHTLLKEIGKSNYEGELLKAITLINQYLKHRRLI